MEDTRRFFDPTLGTVPLSTLYKWIRRAARHVDAIFFDPCFDMLEVGMSVEINWVTREGQRCMKRVERVA